MKLSVRVAGEWLIVPCGEGDQTISWLAEQAIIKYRKLMPDVTDVDPVSRTKKAKNGGTLDPDDVISDVLEDDELVCLELKGEVLPGRPTTRVLRSHDHLPAPSTSANSAPPADAEVLALHGNTLSPRDLVRIGKAEVKVKLSEDCKEGVKDSRKLLDKIVSDEKVVYGITTGFGKFANITISRDHLVELQENLIRSHSAGVGPPLTVERTRMIMALRINVLCKGYSGISLENLQTYVDALNASCLPSVPEKGTVGASGDLAPLSHLALGLMGEGPMWSPETGWGDAKQVLAHHSIKPISLRAKEGLALINGTQLITSLGAEAVERAASIARQVDIVAALTLEALKGTTRALNPRIHGARPHKGQSLVARRMRSVLNSTVFPSEIAGSHRECNKVQDCYTLRCIPQVHGVVNDTVEFAYGIISTEMNSATDNPMVFADLQETMSCGNFHGEYPAKVLDYLAIAVHELAAMSERRIDRMVNPAYSELPAFLVADGGLNSGFMIAHCTAAALVSENKVLCHPSSIDSLTTSAGTEDHVSMGGWSARKCLEVLTHVETVVAIELLCACQGLEFLRPLKSTAPLEEVYKLVRSVVRPWDRDRIMTPDIEAAITLIKEGKVWEVVQPYIECYDTAQVEEKPVLTDSRTPPRSRKPTGPPKRKTASPDPGAKRPRRISASRT